MPNDPHNPMFSGPNGLPPDDFDDDPLDDEFPDFAETENTPQNHPTALKQEKNSPIEQIDISHIPLKIQLEIARISVSLDELQKMKPGSKLPIDINPRIVNLVVGGKSIGQGEIVEIGDIVGVKILELYK